jgi:hypothetical protein
MENQQKDLNPHEFTLEIDGEAKAIRVEVPKPGDYIVYINGERTGHIYPEAGDTSLQWRSKDKISQRLVNEIGAQIEVLEKNVI